MNTIAITTTSFGKFDAKPEAMLTAAGFQLVYNRTGRSLQPEETVELCADATGIIAGTERLDSSVLSQFRTVKVISRCGTGLDNVDLAAAERLGISVVNTPDAPTLAVAELTIGLMLNLLRRIRQADAGIRSGSWTKPMGNLLSGKQVGLIGYGRIGKKIADLLTAFGCGIRYYDIATEGSRQHGKSESLDDLLRMSDIVSIHVSCKTMLLGEREIGLMKPGAWLVNVARGGVVDEAALYRALREDRLSGAALDVFVREPYVGDLTSLDNVVLTPHFASYARESRIDMEMQSAVNLLKGLERYR